MKLTNEIVLRIARTIIHKPETVIAYLIDTVSISVCAVNSKAENNNLNISGIAKAIANAFLGVIMLGPSLYIGSNHRCA